MTGSPANPPYFRAFDKRNNKIFFSLSSHRQELQRGDCVHLHRFVFLAFDKDVILLKASPDSVIRKVLPTDVKRAVELCGSSGNMLDASALMGYIPFHRRNQPSCRDSLRTTAPRRLRRRLRPGLVSQPSQHSPPPSRLPVPTLYSSWIQTGRK